MLSDSETSSSSSDSDFVPASTPFSDIIHRNVWEFDMETQEVIEDVDTALGTCALKLSKLRETYPSHRKKFQQIDHIVTNALNRMVDNVESVALRLAALPEFQ